MAIGIFDSGLGGLSVLKYVIKKYSDEKIIYFADTLNFPYGTKTDDEIRSYAKNIVKFFLTKGVTEVLIACNTASAIALDSLKKEFNIPIIGMIEPVCEYILSNDIKDITLLATNATIKSKAYEKKLKNRIINKIPAPLLVECAENMKKGELEDILNLYLKNVKDLKNILLGCTHFPLLYNEIEKKYPKSNLIDPAKCAVEALNIVSDKGKYIFYTSSDVNLFRSKAIKILGVDDIDVRIYKG